MNITIPTRWPSVDKKDLEEWLAESHAPDYVVMAYANAVIYAERHGGKWIAAELSGGTTKVNPEYLGGSTKEEK